MKYNFLFIIFFVFSLSQMTWAQETKDQVMLSKIKSVGLQKSNAMDMLSELTDVYGQRLTGSREYLKAAQWMAEKMEKVGLQKVHFENYCDNCRGWGINGFNVEMTSPNYMNIAAYPLAMAKSSNGVVEGDLIHISSFRDMNVIRNQYKGKLKGKVILLGKEPTKQSLTKPISKRYTKDELDKLENQLTAEVDQTPLPELFESWKVSDVSDKVFLEFVEQEGALAILRTRPLLLGVLHPAGTYYYKEGDLKPIPYFTIMPEQFGRMLRMINLNETPKIKLNLSTEFYFEPKNNVNVIGELTGSDAKKKSETILLGAHFDSWHAGTGATDNGANSIVLVEALRILKEIGYQPKRTVKVGLWGGEEQAFLGSAAFARDHYGKLNEKPNKESEKVSVYLNLDNGAGAIRGLYLQNNELARPVFDNIFKDLPFDNDWALTIENTLSTDHETFDHYNIPAFQFIQEPLAYDNVTHHTQLDVLEYVPEEDLMKNAVILAWAIYKLSESNDMVPRKEN